VTRPTVRAGGGVVWRHAGDDAVRLELLLVHRPRYDDWTFPKGKCDAGESDEACAAREVEEETGLRCVLGPELATTRYVDNQGRDKVVRYWTMTVEAQLDWAPGDEVDEQAWVPVDEVGARLTYARDLPVLESFLAHRG
jgi:8-oxo-dGTP diphosphatase